MFVLSLFGDLLLDANFPSGWCYSMMGSFGAHRQALVETGQ